MLQKGLGSRLRLYRQLRGLTQDGLSEVIGVSKQHLGQIERGECKPSLDLLTKAGAALETPVANFFLGLGRDLFKNRDNPGSDGPDQSLPMTASGLWSIDLQSGRHVWSKTLCRMLGYSSVRKPSPAHFTRHLMNGGAEVFNDFLESVLNGSVPSPMIIEIKRKDGVPRNLQTQAEIFQNGSNGAALAGIMFWDVTDWLETQRLFHSTQSDLSATIRERTAALSLAAAEARKELSRRHEAERKAQRAHADLQRLVQTIPAIVYSRNLSGVPEHYCSPQIERVLGFSAESGDDGFWSGRVHPEDMETYREAIERMAETGQFDAEYRVLDGFGGVRWLHDRGVVVAENGSLVLQGVATDVTQQKMDAEARQAMKRRNQQLDTMLRLICDNVPDMIWAKDLEKKYIFANKAICEKLLGARDTREPEGKTDLFFAERERARHPDDPEWHNFGEICRDTDQITMDAGMERQFDEYGNAKGEFMYFDVRKAPLFDDEGVMIGTVGSARDVTEQKRMEKELEAGYNALQAILDSIPAEISVMDESSRAVLFTNASLRERLGRDDTGEVCLPVTDMPDEPYPGCPSTAQGPLTTWESWDPENERWTLCFDRQANWLDGRPARIRIAMDITERKFSESLVEKAAEERGILLNHIRTQVWYLTDPMNYGAVNEAHAAFSGRSIADMAFRNLYEIFPADVADICMRGNIEVFSTGKPIQTEELVPNALGERRLLSILKSPKLGADGKVEYVVCSGEDITECRRSEESLKQSKELAEEANRTKSAFMASMSHEIRTPINGVMGMLQLLQSSHLDEDQAAYVGMAMRSCDRLVRLLTDIMDFSRMEAGKLSVRNMPMSIAGILEHVRDMYLPLMAGSDVELRCTPDPALPGRVSGDSLRLVQVLINLVDNACKFTTSGTIRVEAWVLPTVRQNMLRVFFSVEDTGQGISDSELATLFDPFTQFGDGCVRGKQGVGLGLSICKRLVELMGGCMSVVSEIGSGTTFAFSLSFAMETSQPDASSSQEAGPGPALGGRRILLAEDDSVSGVAGVALLGRHGAMVTHVRSGQEALEALRMEPYDAVVMDVQMNDMDGVETTRRIREGEAGADVRDIPVIALTACAMAGDRERFLDAGMNGYVAKPMDIREMLRAVQEVLRT
jgi:PAS domain S-box-containing protein